MQLGGEEARAVMSGSGKGLSKEVTFELRHEGKMKA